MTPEQDNVPPGVYSLEGQALHLNLWSALADEQQLCTNDRVP